MPWIPDMPYTVEKISWRPTRDRVELARRTELALEYGALDLARLILVSVSGEYFGGFAFDHTAMYPDSPINQQPVLTRATIEFTRIRLIEAKLGCGSHPGPCDRRCRKRATKNLSWQDWIRFNRAVNHLLDKLGLIADVWSRPMGAPGKFWIRRGEARRVRYTWHTDGDGRRAWNMGTPDQFTYRRFARR